MNLLLDQIVIFLLAILIDLGVGDPPERIEKFYPVVWISQLMYFFDRRTRRGEARREKILGAVYALLTISIFSIPCLMLLLIHSELLYVILGALVFKMTFTIKGLERYGRKVMEAENLDAKREAVGKIVSREVADLDDEQLNSAAIESVAENTTDSIIAPLFYFALFGIFGAMVYRVVNTLDAVVGYKTRRYEHFGWFSAKTDDVMNYIPERIAAGLILLLSGSKPGDLGNNRGHNKVHLTIKAMSRGLKVKLEKVGYYSVGEEFEGAKREDIEEAICIAKGSAILFAFIVVMALFLFY
jgi:adenosylcobinamide-phosphate synthase